MPDVKRIKNYIKKLKFRQFLRSYGTVFIRYCIFTAIFFGAMIGLNELLNIPEFQMKLIFYLTWIFITGETVFRLYKIYDKKVMSTEYISGQIEDKHPRAEDILVNSVSLWDSRKQYKNPVSLEIIDRVREQGEQIVDTVDVSVLEIKKFLKYCVKLVLLLLAGLGFILAGPPRVREAVNNFTVKVFTPSKYYIEFTPGPVKVPLGGSTDVVFKTNWPAPVVRVERLDSTYVHPAAKSNDEKFSYIIRDIESQIRYRVEIEGGRRRTSWYKVEPDYPPRVESVTLEYFYPDYTGKHPEIVESERIEALRGTRVRVNLKTTREVVEGYLETGGRRYPLMRRADGNLETSFNLEEQEYYKVNLKSSEGIEQTGETRYPINILQDTPPQVNLIYPREYLKVSPDARIEIEGVFRDDIGVKDLYLVYYFGVGGEEKEIGIESFDSPNKSGEFNYIWNISNTGAGEGNLINYRVKAVDGNTLYGPGVGYSYEQQLEIKGFRGQHEQVMEDAQKFQEKILDALEKSYSLQYSISREDYDRAMEDLEMTAGDLENMKQFSRDLTEQMSDNPYIREDTLAEFKGIEDIIDELLDKEVGDLKQSVGEEDKTSASESASKMSDNLEQIMRVAENTTEKQRMSDLSSAATDSLDKARDLADILREDKPAPGEIMEKLQELQNMLSNMQKMVEEFPDSLPEEFINKESIQDTDFSEPGKSMEALMEALRDGDYEQAAGLMDEMIDSLRNIMENIQSASSDTMDSFQNDFDTLSSSVQDKVEQIVEKQEDMLKDTVERRDNLADRKEQYDDQKFEKLREDFQVLKSTLNLSDRSVPVRDIEQEFDRGYLYRTEEYLDDLKEEVYQDWEKEKVENYRDSLLEQPENIDLMDGGDIVALEGLSEDQKSLQEDLTEVTEGMEALNHITALGSGEMLENINLASEEMGDASGELEAFQPGEAAISQRKALSYLSSARQGMEQLSSSMESLSGASGETATRTFSRSGRRGDREGHVEIPGITDEMEDATYRRLILEALREEHPREYRDIIEQYFRALRE